MLFGCFEAFSGNLLKISLFIQKSDNLREKLRNTQKDYFSLKVWKGTNQEENLDLFKQLFLNKLVKGVKF